MTDRTTGADLTRIPALDGLRGVAILAVILYHTEYFAALAQTGSLGRAYDALASRGHYGVDLFFVLSGYLITRILVESRPRRDYYTRFYWRRALRIFPAYYVYLALALWVAPALHMPGALPIPASQQGWYWLYGTNLLAARIGMKAVPEYLNHLWSLAVEEQFYLVWPSVVRLVPPPTLAAVCGALALASLLVREWLLGHDRIDAAYVLTWSHGDGLAVGAALAVLLPQLSTAGAARLRRLAPWGVPPLALLYEVLQTHLAAPLGVRAAHFGQCVVLDGFCALLVAALVVPGSAGLLDRIFAVAPLRRVGRYSYAMYLYQQPITLGLTVVAALPARLAPTLHSPLAQLLVVTALAIVLSVAAGWLSWVLVEQWFARLRVPTRSAAARAAAAPRPASGAHPETHTPPL